MFLLIVFCFTSLICVVGVFSLFCGALPTILTIPGYTHARRGETAQAQAAARITLEFFGRDPNMVHLPLTQTLIDAAERVLEPASGRFGTSVPSWCPFAQEILRAAGNDGTAGTDFSSKVTWRWGEEILFILIFMSWPVKVMIHCWVSASTVLSSLLLNKRDQTVGLLLQ